MPTMESPWVKTSELLDYLRCSRKTLERNRDLFSNGFHYRRLNPKAPNSAKLWHLKRVEEAFCRPVAH
jgi:hypothetical protein